MNGDVVSHRDLPQLTPQGRFLWEKGMRTLGIKPTTKLVAFALAAYADADGSSVFPGEALLARDTGCTTRCVRMHLKILRDDLCLIERVRRGSYGGLKNSADHYRLVWPDDITDRVVIVSSTREDDLQ